jgi:hypothetical protein
MGVMTSPPLERMRNVFAGPEIASLETLAALRELGLVPPADGHDEQMFVPDKDFAPAAAITHLDPHTLHRTDGATGVSGVYVAETYISTESDPPYLRLPSFPEASPYLIIYFMGRAAAAQFTATLDMQVFSTGGSVRITATNSPAATILSNAATGGARVRVPIFFTTTGDGFASLLIQRIGETGFDWFGVDLQ